MDSTNNFSLDNLLGDPKFDFLNSLFSNDDNSFDFSSSPYESFNINCSYVTESQFADLNTVKNELKIMSLNIQSLPAKYAEFRTFISCLQIKICEPDFICLQELWQFPSNVDFSLPGYHPLIFKLRNDTQLCIR
jgi:hypothetical protein